MNSTVKSFVTVTSFSIFTRLISFIFKIWFSRALGAEIVGLYQIALSVILLLFSLTAGAPTVLSRKVAEANARGDVKAQNALTTASILIGLSVAIALCVAFYACNRYLGGLFADQRCVPIFLIMLPTLITSTAYASLRSWFWGRKNFLVFSSTELLDEVIKITLSIIFASCITSTLTSEKGIALAFTVSDFLCVSILLILYFVNGGRFCKPQGAMGIIKSTIPLSTMRILTSLTSSLTAIIVPQRLTDNGMSASLATAEYGRISGMALPLIMAPITIISALSVVLIPDVASLASMGNYVAVREKLKTSLTFAGIIAGLFFVIYLPVGELLGALFFGDVQAGIFVSYCSALIFPIALAQITTPMLNSLGMEKRTFLNYALGAVLMLPCIFILPKYVGVYSMAVGSGVAFTVTSTANLIALRKKLGGFSIKKALGTTAFSIPLGVLGLLSYRLLRSVVGKWFGGVLVVFYSLFFFIIFLSVFDVVTKDTFMLIKPTRVFARRKRKMVS